MNIVPGSLSLRKLATIVLIGSGVGSIAASQHAFAAEASSPQQQVVLNLDSSLLDVMQNAKQLGFAGRYRKILPTVEQVFDVPMMTATAVGAGWSSLTPDQQSDLSAAFAKYIAATYAQQFDGYSGEKFVQTGERAVGGVTLVNTQIVKSDGSPIVLDYVTRSHDGKTQVIDVYLTGTISEMATRRSEFSAVFKQSGYTGLLQSLQQKVAQLAAPSSVS